MLKSLENTDTSCPVGGIKKYWYLVGCYRKDGGINRRKIKLDEKGVPIKKIKSKYLAVIEYE